MTRFEAQTAIEPAGDGIYEAQVHEDWWVARGPHGGYLASIVLRALSARVDDAERPPRSLTVQYVAAPILGPVNIQASIERSGGNSTFTSARMTQDGEVVANALAVFSSAWDGFDFDDAAMPESPGPDGGFPVPPRGEGVPRFLGNFDMRWTIGDPPFSGGSHAVVGGWLRLDEPQIADHIVLATLMDAWAPAVFPRVTQPVIAPTLDLTIHFRTPVPLDGAAPDDYYLGRFSSKLGRDGFFEEDGELWSKDGVLLAQSRQLALVLKRGLTPESGGPGSS